MKYLVLGPAGMGYFSLLGVLSSMDEETIQEIEAISGSSAGAILALFMGMGWSTEKITKISFDIDLSQHIKYSIKGFLTNYGVIPHKEIKEAFVEILGGDPTFKELEKKIYISSLCVDRSKTVYFSRDTHPDMSVIDAVCMSISVPLLFSAFRYKDHLYVDGGTMENIPYPPFLDKPKEQVFAVGINYIDNYPKEITDISQYTQALVRSLLETRIEHKVSGVYVDVENINIFDFSMDADTKLKLYMKGFVAGVQK